MKISTNLLNILVCPVTKSKLVYDEKSSTLISKEARLAYPIKNGIPVLLPDQAIKI